MNATGSPEYFPSPFSGIGTTTLPDFASLLPVVFAIAFFIWLIYTFVVAYHWFRYGHMSLLAIPMLAAHMIVSGILLLLATAGLR